MATIIGDVKELGINNKCVSDFYRFHWERKIALSILPFYRWQFTESPSDAGNDHCMVAVDEGSGKLRGVMGLNRRPFFLNGSMLKGAELTTWIVDDKHIGKGIGAKILINIQSKYDVLIGMGITDMALPVYMRRGFRYIKAIPRYIRVFDFEAIIDYAQHTPLAKKLVKQWLNISNKTPFIAEPISKESIRSLEPLLRKQFNYFSRGCKFLEWRFSKHPVFKYNQYLIYSDGNSTGKGVFVCIRVEESVKNLKILHILDCIGDPLDMKAAISFINDFCTKNGIHLADFYCTSTKVSRHFISSGWFSINDDTCFQFPHLFHPIEFTTPPTTSLTYWSKENFADMAEIGRLYVTKQDADLDRPTVETYHKKEN